MKRKDVWMVAEVLDFYFEYELINHPVGFDDRFRDFFQSINWLGPLIESLIHSAEFSLTQIFTQDKIINRYFFIKKDVFERSGRKRAWRVCVILGVIFGGVVGNRVREVWRIFFVLVGGAFGKIGVVSSCHAEHTVIGRGVRIWGFVRSDRLIFFRKLWFPDRWRRQELLLVLLCKLFGKIMNWFIISSKIRGGFRRMTAHWQGLDSRSQRILLTRLVIRLAVDIDWDLLPTHVVGLFLDPSIEIVLILRTVGVGWKWLVLVTGG